MKFNSSKSFASRKLTPFGKILDVAAERLLQGSGIHLKDDTVHAPCLVLTILNFRAIYVGIWRLVCVDPFLVVLGSLSSSSHSSHTCMPYPTHILLDTCRSPPLRVRSVGMICSMCTPSSSGSPSLQTRRCIATWVWPTTQMVESIVQLYREFRIGTSVTSKAI